MTRFDRLPAKYIQGEVRDGILHSGTGRSQFGGIISVNVPYSGAASKNKKHLFVDGKVINNPSNSRFWKNLEIFLSEIARENRVFFASGHVIDVAVVLNIAAVDRGKGIDAANLVDGVCDAVAAAIGVNDRWYCGSWAWRYDDSGPETTVTVSVSQQTTAERLAELDLPPTGM